MIRDSERLRSFERAYARQAHDSSSFAGALAVFEALWREAAALNPDFPGDWRADIEPDIDVARAVNGLPPRT